MADSEKNVQQVEKKTIVSKLEPVLVVGGGPVQKNDFMESMDYVSDVIAADGGAASCLQYGITPSQVIGDMDSLQDAVRSQLDERTICEISDQDSTDFDKVLRKVDAPMIIGAGFLGARIDHQLAAQSTLVHMAHKKVLLLGVCDVMCVLPPEFALNLPIGSRCSLYPLAPVNVMSKGLEWPTNDIAFSPLDRIGTSNRVTGPMHLNADAPYMLLILPRRFFRECYEAYSIAPSWSAHAK